GDAEWPHLSMELAQRNLVGRFGNGSGDGRSGLFGARQDVFSASEHAGESPDAGNDDGGRAMNLSFSMHDRPGDPQIRSDTRRMGSTGHWPMPSGDPPDGMETGVRPPNSSQSVIHNPALPVGESPTGTGGSPVPPRRRLRAFTLIELVLAIGITAIVLVAINGIFFSAMHLRESVTEAVDGSLPVQQAC